MSDYILHSGVKGQKWGIRRYRNEDGSLTNAGKAHYEKLQQLKSFWQRYKEFMTQPTVNEIAESAASGKPTPKREDRKIIKDKSNYYMRKNSIIADAIARAKEKKNKKKSK